jgi:hypothetical membrane protein
MENILAFFKNPILFQWLSLAGALSAVLGSLIASLAYRGRQGERYSPLNHFISELGEEGVSRRAWAFNLGMILCGLCLLPACVSLGLLLPGVLSKLGMLAGIVTAISIALVGVFPMNKLTPHIRAAVTYFRFGLVMVTLFTAAIAFQPQSPPAIPRLIALVGLPAIFAYAYFLLYSRVSYAAPENPLDTQEQKARPRFWRMAAAEWAIFLTTVPWFLAVAAGV